MAGKTDKKLLWHPQNQNRFIVGGGTQITLFSWEPEVSGIQFISSQADLQLMKCFTWSPDPSFDDLVAVGLSSGKVELWRLEANKHTKNTISIGPQISLAMQSARNALALSFSKENPNHLAVGYDKHRNDSCLMIYDVAATATSSHPNSSASSRSTAGKRALLQALPVPETISSLVFLSDSLLVAGVQNQWLRMYDTRVSGVHVAQAPTTKLHGIVTDPFDKNRIACYGDNSVSIWDTRMMSNALLTFSCKDAAADGDRQSSPFINIEFSPVRRGVLATLNYDSHHVRFWNIEKTPFSEGANGENDGSNKIMTQESSRTSKLSRWASPSTILQWSSTLDQNRSSSRTNINTDKVNNTILSDTFQSDQLDYPIMSFALARTSLRHPMTSNMIVLGKDGELKPYVVNDIATHTIWSARGEALVGAGTQLHIFPGFRETAYPPEPWDIEAIVGNVAQASNVAAISRDVSTQTKSRMRSVDRYNSRNGSRQFASPDVRSSSLSLTRGSSRTYSPISVRRNSGDSILPDPPHLESEGASKYIESITRVSSRSISRGRKHSRERDCPRGLESDISMLMRRRVIYGYCLTNHESNARVLSKSLAEDEEILSNLWSWCDYSRNLGSSKIHGIDFSYQGILGIWEGLKPTSSQEVVSILDGLDLASPSEASSITLGEMGPSVDVTASLRPRPSYKQSQRLGDGFHGNYMAALNILNSRGNLEKSQWKPTIHTDKSQQRRLALELVDWKVSDEDFLRWEKEGKQSQAACWWLFNNQGGKAMSLLMRSKNESHQMFSGILAVLLQANHEYLDYHRSLATKLQDPYQRIMLSSLIFNDWIVKLEKETIPLRERLAIALRFSNDKELTAFLRNTIKDCIEKGNIEGIIVTGLTPKGLDILQSYVDFTGDVQTAALLSSYVCPGRYKDSRAERWAEAYRDLLDGWKLFHHRCQFDIDRGKILKEGIWNGDFPNMEWVKKQFMLKCNHCNKFVNIQQRPHEPVSMQRKRAAACPFCGRALPRCSVCLMNICIIPDSVRDSDLLHSSFRDTIDDALVFCQTCRHGGHASHIFAWFFDENGERRGRLCPVADCECKCDDEDGN